MTSDRSAGGGVVVVSFIIALLLTILPLPDWAAPYRPDWVLLVLIYWCMALPERIGVGTGWVMGLLLDVINGVLLGLHALAFSVVAYLAMLLHRRIRVFPLWQQALTVLILVGFSQLLVLWVLGITGTAPRGWQYWLPSLTSMVLWPWIFVLLRDVRRRFSVR